VKPFSGNLGVSDFKKYYSFRFSENIGISDFPKQISKNIGILEL
jgi:hypothetical protein